MEKNSSLILILISVITLVLVGLSVPVLMNTPPQLQATRGGFLQLKIVISFINLGLIIPLFFIYAGIYRRMRTSFTLGLMAVVLAFALYAITSNPVVFLLADVREGCWGIYQIIPDLFATIALMIMMRLSLE